MIPKHPHWMWLAAPLAVLAVAAGARAATPPAAAVRPPAQPEVPTCEEGTLAEVEPAEAVVLRLRDRQARIFLEVLAGGPDPSTTVGAVADGAAVLSGPDVLGGIVALALRGECVIGHRFISPLELMDATTVVELHEQHPELGASGHLDAAGLQKLADAGDPAAEFHAGIVKALGPAASADRAQSIDWLRRSAAHGHGAGMIALGMSLAGPGIVEDEARIVGEARRRDELTDLAQSCYWLRRAVRVDDPWLRNVARFVFDVEVAPRMTSEETRRCLSLLKAPRADPT